MLFRTLRVTAMVCATSALVASAALACQFDTDCQLGNQCLKADGSIYGVCGEGVPPGAGNDRQPGNSPLDLDGAYTNTCRSDTDCDLESYAGNWVTVFEKAAYRGG